MNTSNWIKFLFFATLLYNSQAKAIRQEDFYIFPDIYLQFSFANEVNVPTDLVVIRDNVSPSKPELFVDPDFYGHLRKYEYLKSVDKSLINKEQRVQEMIKIHELCQEAEEKPANDEALLFHCPRALTIYPCVCQDLDQSLDCSKVESFIKLKELLNEASAQDPGIKFNKFKYIPGTSGIRGETLLDNTFGSWSFISVHIGDSDLTLVESNAFSGSETTLKYLSFDDNRNLPEVPFQDILNDFPHLIGLAVMKGKLITIPKLSSTSLRYVDLFDNAISTISYDTFQNLPKLITLDLGYNNIKTIGPRGWSINTAANIFIDKNGLTSVSAFTSHQPGIFDASDNELTSFSQEVYEPILEQQESFINVAGNPINCEEMTWATENTIYSSRLTSDC